MKKQFCIFIFLSILLVTNTACQNSPKDKMQNSLEEKSKHSPENLRDNKDITLLDEAIEGSTEVQMRYEFSSYAIKITNQSQINQLEDIFNRAEFYETKEYTRRPQLHLVFKSNKKTTDFYLNDQDYVILEGNRYVKSKGINFEKFFSIYKEETEKLFNSLSDIEEVVMKDLLGTKIRDTVRIFMTSPGSSTAIVYNQAAIKQLENLFNKAKFYKSDAPSTALRIQMTFFWEKWCNKTSCL